MYKNIVNRISKLMAAAVMLVAANIAIGSQVVSATNADFNLSVPINTVKFGEKGSRHELASRNIPAANRGMKCSVNATAENQHSVHPGNNLVIASGSTSVTLEDVEREGGALTVANGTLVLGNTLTVTLVMGKDKVFSGGMDVNVSCKEETVEVCRDGVITTIKKSERRTTDTDAPCPTPTFNASIICNAINNKPVYTLKIDQTAGAKNVTFAPKDGTVLENGNAVTVTGTYNDGKGEKSIKVTAPAVANCSPERVNVCRDGKVVNIVKTDRKETDKDAPCPEVKAATTVTELPKTGAGSIAGIIGATFGISTIAAHLRMRRNAAKRA